MKITYTAPVRAHHFNYAAAIHRAGALHTFLTGANRFSPRAKLPEIGDRLKRRDLIQTVHLLSLMAKAPDELSNLLGRLANKSLDMASYHPAKQSDVFLYYRTCGLHTTRRLKRESAPTLCVMEEVNSHMECCHGIMKAEYEKLGLGRYTGRFQDHDLRLRAYEEADVILCPSGFVRQSFLEKGFDPEKLLTVNFGFTLPKGESSKIAKPGEGAKFTLLYVGQLHFRKGLRYAIEAFRALKHPRKELIIVGPAAKVTGLEGVTIPDGVTFTGVLKGDALASAYASASAFVLPTMEEGLALVLGEAMVAGLPIVATNRSGGDDLINDGVEGFIVSAGDSSALAVAFQKLADSPDLRERMGHAAIARARELGNWDVAARKLIDGFSSLLAARKA